MPDRPEILSESRIERGGASELRLRVRYDGALYRIVVRPVTGANREAVGYDYWVGNATPLLGDEQRVITTAMDAVTRLHPT